MWRYQLLARWKYLLSFRKGAWTLDDYPVRVRRLPAASPPPGMRDLKPVAWHAQIIHWPQLFGAGDTQAEALANLRQRFADYQREHGDTPRPGVPVPLEFAPTTMIDRYAPVARDFFDRILGMDFDACFISDESSLWDFPHDEDERQVLDRIRAAYGVDVSDIQNGNLARIFAQLQAAGHRGRAAGRGE